MSMQDTTADMLTRIRNGQMAKKVTVIMPSSKFKIGVAEVLKAEGYIVGYSVTEEIKPVLTIELKYFEGKPVIESIDRISKPGLRIYKNAKELQPIKGGLATLIVSTNKGIMTDKSARQQGVGGEVVCQVS